MQWKWLAIAAGLLFLIWLPGFVPHFWAGLGVLALVAFFMLIQQFEKFRKISTLLFAGWILLFLAAPITLRFLPATQDEIIVSRDLFDVRTGERLHIPAGRSFQTLRNWCNTVEASYVQDITKEYGLQVDQSTGRIDQGVLDRMLLRAPAANDQKSFIVRSDKDAELRAKILAVKKWRAECSDFILAHSKRKLLPTMDSYAWFITLSALVIGGFIVGASSGKPQISRTTFGVALLLTAAVVFHSLFLQPIATPTTEAWSKLSPSEVIKALEGLDTAEKRRAIFWAFALVLGGAVFLSRITGISQINRIVWSTAVLLSLALLFDWLWWGGGTVHKIFYEYLKPVWGFM